MYKYTLNKDYFKEVNSEDKAYFLGLLYADGYNHEERSSYVSLSLQEIDCHILNDFQKYLNSNYPIQSYKSNCNNCSNQKRLQINGYKFSKNLSKLGCYQRKAKTLIFPSDTIVPEYLIRHFIRGYFDGDGSVWESKRKIMNVKDSRMKEGRRDRIIHNVKFNFTGTISMIEGIQNILIKDLNFRKNKINCSKNIENCVQLEYSGRLQMKKFYDFLYNKSNVYFNRKKEKFENILNLC